MPHAQSRRHDHAPVLITAAGRSLEEQFAARRRRYTLIMAFRIPCLVLAGVFGIGFGITWVAVALIAASVPLPWIAVLIANDAPPRRVEKVARVTPAVSTQAPRSLETPFVIDAPEPTDGAEPDRRD